jgi:SpoVK/Ycf46/Vps4 family AAA+-type ATPase
MNKYYTFIYFIIVTLLGYVDLNFIFIFLIILFLIILIYIFISYYYLCEYISYDDIYDLNYFNDMSKIIGSSDNFVNLNYKDHENSEDSECKENYSVCLNDIKCNKTNSTTETLSTKLNKINIVSIKNIINNEEIRNINDLILIADYYEKNYFFTTGEKKEAEVKLEKTVETIVENDNIEEQKYLYKYGDNYYTINLEKIHNIRGNLINLKKMVGLTEIKNKIIDMLLYYLTKFGKKNEDMLHMTLEGPPGCGKTKLAKIISKILNGIGILNSDKIIYAKSTDLIAEYVGQTGPKTQKVINRAFGGILFIDEAYSLGNSMGREHNFSAECINVLNQNLSDNKNKFICIIAGYSEELENMFFSTNPGLRRRFPFRFTISGYSHSELLKIFINKIYKLKWKIASDVDIEKFFKDNSDKFKCFGGDIDILIQNIKYSYSRRIICSKPKKEVIIKNIDINNGFANFIDTKKDPSVESSQKISENNELLKSQKENKKLVNKIKKIFNTKNIKEINLYS